MAVGSALIKVRGGENECISYNFRLFAMFLPKIIRVCGNLTEL